MTVDYCKDLPFQIISQFLLRINNSTQNHRNSNTCKFKNSFSDCVMRVDLNLFSWSACPMQSFIYFSSDQLGNGLVQLLSVVMEVKVQEESPTYKQIYDYMAVRRELRRLGKRTVGPVSKITSKVKYNYSLWQLEENGAYMQFLEDNEQLFRGSKNDRRLVKINVLMSMCVRTRSPDQCRSHHQKMMKYHRDIPTIIQYIRHLIEQSPTDPLQIVKLEPTQEPKIEQAYSSSNL